VSPETGTEDAAHHVPRENGVVAVHFELMSSMRAE